MKNNRIISLIAAVAITVACLSSCGGIKKLEDLKITSANLTSFSPEGMKGLGFTFKVGVDNPGAEVSLSNISGEIKHFGKVLGKVAVDPFTLKARSTEDYYLNAGLKFDEKLTLQDMGKFMDRKALEELTVDIHATAKLKGGISRDLVFNDIPLKKLIENAMVL